MRLSQNLCKPISSDSTVMPELIRHPHELQGDWAIRPPAINTVRVTVFIAPKATPQ